MDLDQFLASSVKTMLKLGMLLSRIRCVLVLIVHFFKLVSFHLAMRMPSNISFAGFH